MSETTFRENSKAVLDNMGRLDTAYRHGEPFPRDAYDKIVTHGTEWLNHAVSHGHWRALKMMLPYYVNFVRLERKRPELRYETPTALPLMTAMMQASTALEARKHNNYIPELNLPQKTWKNAVLNRYILRALHDENFAAALALSLGWTERKAHVQDRIVDPDGTCLHVARIDTHNTEALASYLEQGAYRQVPVVTTHPHGISIVLKTTLDMSDDTIDVTNFTNIPSYREGRVDDDELPEELQGMQLGALNEDKAALFAIAHLKKDKAALEMTGTMFNAPNIAELMDRYYKDMAALIARR